MNPDKPYPVLVIAAFVGFAIVLMVWALTGTHGRTSMDAAQKSSQTTGAAIPRHRTKKPFPPQRRLRMRRWATVTAPLRCSQ